MTDTFKKLQMHQKAAQLEDVNAVALLPVLVDININMLTERKKVKQHSSHLSMVQYKLSTLPTVCVESVL